jgi:lipoprotein-anchoring transpeptidase ErfK/SrfK
MKYLFAFPLLIGAALPLSASGAQAQYYAAGPTVIGAPDYARAAPAGPPFGWRPAQQQASNLGGGLIELLATGSAPGPVRPGPGAYAQPQPPHAQPAPGYNAPRNGMAPGGPAVTAYAAPPSQPTAYQRPVMSEPEPQYRRQEVAYDGPQAAGTIIIDTPRKFLFLVQPGGRAIRYGIGVGRPGFEWSGMKAISRKAEWPGWTPPPEMLKRRPDLPTHMGGGPANPLGARAMYLGSSLYRIHGTNEPETIGKNVSSGCIRMLNEDVIDLYERAKVGTRVVVI